ncbi:hypothetical protein B7R22_17155 [Subtercola boreus]|uniref:Uncharacterized protein n=1 Tax=Subtercola boreus TaxID=120213 RepID=A0A3E0VQJ7_9MICO|nr:hypothetical protein [Subtercola boreus]RFA12156.1 hypothetical protein B7R22_17155 [Subtercola boreus]
MGNSARELAQLLVGWRDKLEGQSIYGTREGAAPGSLEFWRTQGHAIDLLEDTDRMLAVMAAAGRPIDHYEPAVIACYRGIFSADFAWSTPQGEAGLIPQWAIGLLISLAEVIDGLSPSVGPSQEQRATVSEGLTDVFALLSDESLGLSTLQREYVFELVSEIRKLLEENHLFGSVDLVKRINELYGVLSRIMAGLDDTEESGQARDKIRLALAKIAPVAWVGIQLAGILVGGASSVQSLTAGPPA